MPRLFSPDFDLIALGNARKAIRRGDDRAAERWLKVANLQMTIALRVDMHRWLEVLRYDKTAMRARSKRAEGEVRKWKNDVPFPLPDFAAEKPLFPQRKTGA